jgi:hypothetical protein
MAACAFVGQQQQLHRAAEGEQTQMQRQRRKTKQQQQLWEQRKASKLADRASSNPTRFQLQQNAGCQQHALSTPQARFEAAGHLLD